MGSLQGSNAARVSTSWLVLLVAGIVEQPPLTPNIFPFSFGLFSVTFVTSWTLPPLPPYDITFIL